MKWFMRGQAARMHAIASQKGLLGLLGCTRIGALLEPRGCPRKAHEKAGHDDHGRFGVAAMLCRLERMELSRRQHQP